MVWVGAGVATTAGAAVVAGAVVEVAAVVGVATAGRVVTVVLVLATVFALTLALVPAVVAVTVVVLLACLGVWHPTSIVAATNMIGTVLRIIVRSNGLCCFSNSPLPRLTESNLRIVVK